MNINRALKIASTLAGLGFASLITVLILLSKHRIEHKEREMVLEVTTQSGLVDTFKVKAVSVTLYRGDLFYTTDTNEYSGGHHIIASGVYNFKLIK